MTICKLIKIFEKRSQLHNHAVNMKMNQCVIDARANMRRLAFNRLMLAFQKLK